MPHRCRFLGAAAPEWSQRAQLLNHAMPALPTPTFRLLRHGRRLGERGLGLARPADPAPVASAFTWLGRGLTQTVTAQGRLRPNLHRLQEEDWILFEGERGRRQILEKKQETLESPNREKYLLNTSGSLQAQAEVLDMFLQYLPRRYPEYFQVSACTDDCDGSRKFGPQTLVTVSACDWHAQYRVGDFSECPIELASRLVCEDLVLLEDGVVCAGSVMFSFSQFHKRFGLDMNKLHAKVPQYEKDLQKPVNRLFASLSPDRPLCRSNWNISWSDDIMAGYSRYPHRNPGISEEERKASLQSLRQTVHQHGLAKSAWLKVEYQTLKRLPQNSSCILFTIRTFLNSFAELADEPAAARSLLSNLQQLESTDFSQYLGIDDPGVYALVKSFVQDASCAGA